MEPLLCYPDPVPRTLAGVLDRAGYSFKSVARPDDAFGLAPDDGWSGAVIWGVDDFEGALAMCAHVRGGDLPLRPLLLVVPSDLVGALPITDDLFDDFLVARSAWWGRDPRGGAPGPPVVERELEARLTHLFFRTGMGTRPDLVEYGALTLNVETYQALLDGRHLDLTFMEYELLRFLASSPGKVFTRETLLSRVWGYEYYGGARTVDVHVRRLRAKLGEEHAHLIQTVRSVGYRFGESRWVSR